MSSITIIIVDTVDTTIIASTVASTIVATVVTPGIIIATSTIATGAVTDANAVIATGAVIDIPVVALALLLEGVEDVAGLLVPPQKQTTIGGIFREIWLVRSTTMVEIFRGKWCFLKSGGIQPLVCWWSY